MRTFSSADCLNLWEAGAGLHPLDQGLLLLGVAFPETLPEALPDWPLGRRNAALARLRCATFGPRLQGWTACGRCGEQLEVEFDGETFAAEQGRAEEPVVVNGQSFRLLTTRDLALAAHETDVRRTSVRLAERCCLMENRESPAWSDEELEEIGERLALADPLAETRLALRCPECAAEWEENLDLAAFFWREIEARARRLLTDVHTLASAYGWAETDILALSERRRARYLEMVQS